MPGLEGLDAPHDRLCALAQGALARAAGHLPEGLPDKTVLVLTLLPPAETARSRNLDQAALEHILVDCHPRLDSACLRFVTADQGPIEMLQEACAALHQEQWQAVLFGGVDSLVDGVTCMELASRKQAMPKGGVEGIIPGEGAAYLVLQNQPTENCLARISTAHTAPEPHHDQAHAKSMTGMTAALRSAMKDAGIQPEILDSIVWPFGNRMVEALEWHQVVETVWPRRENIPRDFEILRPALTLGETGAASLPLGLALGCARFAFEFPPIDNLLVCTCHPTTCRGAVGLKRVKQSSGAEAT